MRSPKAREFVNLVQSFCVGLGVRVRDRDWDRDRDRDRDRVRVRVKEAIAAGTIRITKEHTSTNLADILTKANMLKQLCEYILH